MSESFAVTLWHEPPTVTHHDKKLGWRFGRGGRKVPSMRDSRELASAIDTYMKLLAASGRRPRRPLEGRIWLEVVFCFRAAEWDLHTTKPDRDNLLKTLQDCLASAGWIKQDSQVCCGPITKIEGPTPFVDIHASVVGVGDGRAQAEGLACRVLQVAGKAV